MKRLLFSILFILYSFIVYAQDNSTATKEESFSDKLNKELEDIDKLNYKDYPMTVGLYGGAYFPTDYRDVLGIGGNVGIRYKFNFNKFLALSADLGYTYSSGSSKNSTNTVTWNGTSHMFDIRLMGIFQYETKKGESGFVPWIGTGAVISFASTKEKVEERYVSTGNVYRYTNDYSGAGIGYIVALGFRYNFKKVYTGLNFDYTLTYPGFYDLSGFRLNAELGYRF